MKAPKLRMAKAYHPPRVPAGSYFKTPAAPSNLPHPARNLGPHLKPPASGEIVTSHHRGAKKP